MKFLLFSVDNIDKNRLDKIYIDGEHYINKVTLSSNTLTNLSQEPKNFLGKLKNILYSKRVDYIILKALEGYDKKWYYVFEKDMGFSQYLTIKLEKLLGYKLLNANELDTNIFKYIEEYSKNNSLKKHELKVLLVVNNNKNLNFTTINNLIKEYKNVNIYLSEEPTNYILKRIKQINKEEGTTIDIVKKDRKVFNEYDVVYFLDDKKENYPRFRLNKRSLVMDIDLSYKDKYNTSNIFLNDYLLKDEVCKENIEDILKQYNRLEVGKAIMKIVN